jgi:hypothetical protein
MRMRARARLALALRFGGALYTLPLRASDRVSDAVAAATGSVRTNHDAEGSGNHRPMAQPKSFLF